MSMKNNTDFELIVRYLAGELSDRENRDIEQKISQDKDLRKLVGLLRDQSNDTERSSWDKLKIPAHKLLERQLKETRKSRGRGHSRKRGVTTFDSGLLPVPEGVRPATVDTRRLKYRIDRCSLELSLYPVSPGSYEIIGQVSGLEGDRELSISLTGNGKPLTISSNQFHLFRFPRVPVGEYEMHIKSDSGDVAIIDISI